MKENVESISLELEEKMTVPVFLKTVSLSMSRRVEIVESIDSFLHLQEDMPNENWSGAMDVLRRFGVDSSAEIYKPICQIAAFENLCLPSFAGSPEQIRKELEEILLPVLFFYFPKEDITKESNGNYTLTLKSPTYQRLYYLQKLCKEPLWRKKYFEGAVPEILGNLESVSLRERAFLSLSHSGEMTEREPMKKISFEMGIIPTDIIPYISVLLGAIKDLVDYSRWMHLFSGLYPKIREEIWSLFEEIEREQEGKYKEAVRVYEDALETRIFPVAKLNHVTAREKAQKEGIDSLFLPFREGEPLFPAQTPVFVYEKTKNENEWVLYPPTERPIKEEGLTFLGIFYYSRRDTEDKHLVYSSPAEEDAPEYKVVVEPGLLTGMIPEVYPEWEHLEAVRATMRLQEEYPRLFMKNDYTPGTLSVLQTEGGEGPFGHAYEVAPRQEESFLILNESGEPQEVQVGDWVVVAESGDYAKIKRMHTRPNGTQRITLSKMIESSDETTEVFERPEALHFPSSEEMKNHLRNTASYLLYTKLLGDCQEKLGLTRIEKYEILDSLLKRRYPERFEASGVFAFQTKNHLLLFNGGTFLSETEIREGESARITFRREIERIKSNFPGIWEEYGVHSRSLLLVYRAEDNGILDALHYDV